MILKTLGWLTKAMNRVEDMERRLRSVDDLVRGFGGLEYRVGYLEDRWHEAGERLDLMSDALDEADEDDGVPRVSVVDMAAMFNIRICELCERRNILPCMGCDWPKWKTGNGSGPLPSRFELREDLR